MVSELSFLIDLLLNHDLPKATKDLIASRIKEVEINLTAKVGSLTKLDISKPASFATPPINMGMYQAPSTLAAMARHGEIPFVAPVVETPVPVENIAQTPATAAALASRAEAIASAGKVDPKGKRKW